VPRLDTAPGCPARPLLDANSTTSGGSLPVTHRNTKVNLYVDGGEACLYPSPAGSVVMIRLRFAPCGILAPDLLMKRFELETSISPGLAQFSRVP